MASPTIDDGRFALSIALDHPRGWDAGVAVPPRPIPSARTAVTTDRATGQEKFFAFLLGLGTRLQVQLIGYLPFTEIFLLLTLPHFLRRTTAPACLRRTGWCLPLLGFWLFSLIASDVYRQTQWSLSARGIARIVIFAVAIPFFTWFLRSGCYDKLLWWTIGTLPSFVLSAYVFRGGVHEGRERVLGQAEIKYDTHWGGVFGIAVVIFCLIVYQRSRILCYAASVSLGFYHIMNAMRATGAYTILGAVITAALNALRGRSRLHPAGKRIAAWKLLLVALVSMAAGYGILNWYSHHARIGTFGERARWKYISQARNRFGLLAGGRPEFIGGLLAVSESPILGYGSWPLDKDQIFLRACEIMEVELDPHYYVRGYPLIPSHSHILGAWVESGILGIFFWFYVFGIAARSVYMPIQDEKRLRFWVVSSALSLMWAILFSPISARLETSFFLGLVFNQVMVGGNGLRMGPGLPDSRRVA